ncbi:MAG: hypothetical protein IPN94_05025 [Sphingobacteriales bacterium]|nr:hypothetical protein [Sphingobacteriales bacterium]
MPINDAMNITVLPPQRQCVPCRAGDATSRPGRRCPSDAYVVLDLVLCCSSNGPT